MQTDPRDILLKSPMTSWQVIIVAITIGLNALDGFDVLSISFASPGIRAEWGLGPSALGFVLSIAGPVTFANANGLRDAVRAVPMDRLLVETDCPYLTPVPHRGKRNEPAYVRHTAEAVAAVHGVPLEAFAEASTRAAREVFQL